MNNQISKEQEELNRQIIHKAINMLMNEAVIPFRGRIEVDCNGWNVIEFESDKKIISDHYKGSDSSFSRFPEYKTLLPKLQRIIEIVKE